MSTIVFAGAAQFAAVGYVASGLAWPGIVLLTALLNARHLLYSAALAPCCKRDVPFGADGPRGPPSSPTRRSRSRSAISGGLGRGDERGYWLGAIVATFIPWNLATLAGVLLGAQIPDPTRFGIDVIFPAAMIGLAVGLITGRRELVAAIVGAGVAVGVALVSSPAIGIVAGGVIGPADRSPACPGLDGRREGPTGDPPRPDVTRCPAPTSTPRRARNCPPVPEGNFHEHRAVRPRRPHVQAATHPSRALAS